MKKTLIFIAGIIFAGSVFAETIKLGPFELKKVEIKEQKVKMKNVVIKEIKDNIIYLEDGEIELEKSVNDLTASNPKFLVDFTGNPKRVQEMKFPAIADIEAIKTVQPSEIPYRNIKKVLKIIIRIQGDKEVKKALKEQRKAEEK